MRRAFVARLESGVVAIEVEDLGSSLYRVTIDGESRVFDARFLADGRLSLVLDGGVHEASVVRAGDDVDVLLRQQRFRFRLMSEAQARRLRGERGDNARGRREIKASMPGKVVDVLVKIGDAVEAQQGLLIVEAMKMENEIRSPGPGEVKDIRVEPGEAVEAGEVLAVVE